MEPPEMTSTKRAGFMDLPAEVRNDIYEMHYRHHNRVNQEIMICHEKAARDIPSALSRTCRQVREDTVPYFYTGATVIFRIAGADDFTACQQWLDMVPANSISALRTIEMRYNHGGRRERADRYRLNMCMPVWHFDLPEQEDWPILFDALLDPDCEKCKAQTMEREWIIQFLSNINTGEGRRAITNERFKAIVSVLHLLIDGEGGFSKTAFVE